MGFRAFHEDMNIIDDLPSPDIYGICISYLAYPICLLAINMMGAIFQSCPLSGPTHC
eukprot:c37640_g1_i1 orf=22-192(-)